ncbi:MAG: energy transducer TonB [Burkholderiaceae bacterium]
MAWASGNRYEGDWIEGKRTGSGVFTRPNGDRYEGQFLDGKWSGKGIMTSTIGGRYEGDWVENKRAGKGKQVYSDGGQYDGNWIDDKPSGQGVMVAADGRRYEGEFVDGKPAHPESIVRQQYSIKESHPQTGSNIRHDQVSGISVPPEKSYAELLPDEKSRVKLLYEPMADADEPPYPLHGPLAFLTTVHEIQNKLQVTGELSVAVSVDSEGRATSVEVFKSPDREMVKAVASALMLQKYKPAVCNGIPCKMQYPVRITFRMEH